MNEERKKVLGVKSARPASACRWDGPPRGRPAVSAKLIETGKLIETTELIETADLIETAKLIDRRMVTISPPGKGGSVTMAVQARSGAPGAFWRAS